MQFIIAIIAVLVGAAFCFGGFRFFLLLLPIWGFVVGFNVGTDAVTAIFSDGTFATVTSWVVGLRARPACSPCSRTSGTGSRSRSWAGPWATSSARAPGA